MNWIAKPRPGKHAVVHGAGHRPLDGAVQRCVDLRWPDSQLFNIGVSLSIGIAYALLIMGPEKLNPANVSWFRGDVAQYYIAWALFAQTPGWHWPLTFTDRIGFPVGDAVANMDPNSLIMLLLKPLCPMLPATFQYLGMSVVLACALQFYFGAWLMRILIGHRLLPVLCGGLLLEISPVMTRRLNGHFALANHWVILAALCLYFATQRRLLNPDGRQLFLWSLLGAAAVAVHPYLAFCVLGVGAAWCLRATLVRLVRPRRVVPIAAVVTGSLLLTSWAIGLLRFGGGLTAGGYRFYSMNLLAPIDSGQPGAAILPALPGRAGQIEGYNYLGLGTLVLVLFVGAAMIAGRWNSGRSSKAEVVPLLLVCAVFTAMALSTKVTAGSHVLVDLDPKERFTPWLSVLRASGRLFWLPYYVITASAVALLFRAWSKATATAFLIGVLLLQFFDEYPLRRWVKIGGPAPRTDTVLRSAVWGHLGEKHQNLLVFPPWQCSPADTPGGGSGFAIFGLLAASQHMRINSYYAARYSPQSLTYHCSESFFRMARPLRDDSAYIVTPQLARLLMAADSRPNLCHEVDGFILCSAVTDFGLRPGLIASQ